MKTAVSCITVPCIIVLASFTAAVSAERGTHQSPVAREAALVRSIVEAVQPLGVRLDDAGRLVSCGTADASKAEAVLVTDYQNLVTTAEWTERRPRPDGTLETVGVKAEVWTKAIQACLDEHDSVRIPRSEKPYYIDAPLVLKTGNRLFVDPETEIRLKPGTNRCMVRNRSVADGTNGPVVLGEGADSDIVIEGGIWTTLATTPRESNGNIRGGAFTPWRPRGAHGTIMISNARRVVVRNLTIKECRPHGVQIGNCSGFLVENIVFENHGRDGVHMGGPAENGVVRKIRGVTGDDMIALNAWDWRQSNATFGPIRRILVDGVVAEKPSAVRLLAGTKNFEGGKKSVDCDITDCVIRDIRGMHEIKIYDQPNLEVGRDNDFADPIGDLANLFFRDIHVDHPAPPLFQIASNVDRIDIRDVVLHFDPAGAAKPFCLVEVGPMSMTYKSNPKDPRTWVEVFSPDKSCTVRGLSVSGVRYAASESESEKTPPSLESDLVRVRNQKLNPDYPRTTPRGGIGKGTLIRE